MTDRQNLVYVFDAYGTLFDVHAAIGQHRAAAGPDADRFSEIWRSKQLEYAWILTLAGRYEDFWTLTERALDYAFSKVASVDRVPVSYTHLQAVCTVWEVWEDRPEAGAYYALCSM